MGDLVLGVAKTVVEGTLVRAKSAIDEEAKLKQTVQRDLVFISGEFQMMQCFLNITDEERAKNAVVNTWVRQLRDLAFDVEDCIEFVVHLDNKPAWWWRVVPSCMAPPLPLDQAVDNIKELKARVEDVSQRNMRYNLISSDSGSGSGSSKPKPVVAPVTAGADAAEFDMLVEAKAAARKRRGLCNLTELINCPDPHLQVISLWGTGSDLGMTSIVRKAYVDRETRQNFTWRAWVKIIHPFNPQELIRSFLAQLHAKSRQEQQPIVGADVLKRMKMAAVTEEHDLADEFMRQVSEHRYLVVLEGLSTMVDWDAARAYLPDTDNGSRIIVSTQQFEIASLCTGHPYQISEIRHFSPHHSVCVFFKEGCQRVGDKYQDDVGHGENLYAFESEAAQILDVLKRADSEIRGNKDSLAFQVMSVIAGAGKSALVSSIYHGQMESKYRHRWGKYAWVNISRPFELKEFSRILLRELCSLTTEDAQLECPNLYYSGSVQDRCRDVLREHRCLFVINGLESMEQWDNISTGLGLEAAKGSTIVITNEASLAMHCADSPSLVCDLRTSEREVARHLFKDQGSQCNRGKHKDEMTCTVAPTPGENIRLVGRRSEEAKILHMLGRVDFEIKYRQTTGPNEYRMSVWGIAGVGKSALVRSIYHGQMESKFSHRWSKYGWVNVPSPFNLREFSWSLLLDLSSKSTNGNASEDFGMSSIEDPIKECRDILHAHRCLVVIDDLQSVEDWESINTALGLGSAKAHAIIITNEASLATHCADDDSLVRNIRSLESDVALQLFEEQTPKLRPRVMQQVELALTKCGGLPKVIIAVCHYMATRSIDAVMSWELLNNDFMHELEGSSYGLQGLFVWMQSYFSSCPDSLKPCVFYLPIFPPNYNIRRRRLLRRWIAEGYCRDTVNATAEQNGEKSFEKLVDLSMIQQLPQTIKLEDVSVALCNVNGFFREYIVSQPMEDNMVFALEERCSQNSQYIGRHLVIRSSWDRDRYVFESIDFSRLRSLTVFGDWKSFLVSEKMKVLRVLDLEDTSGVTDDDLEQIGKLLSRLKFLSLRGCTSVSRLPTSLGNLKQLETLDVRHSSVTMLPRTIINLQKLQYIRVGTTVARAEEPSTQHSSEGSWLPKFRRRQFMGAHLGARVPRGIGKLTALDTLGVVNVGGKGGNAILRELKNLTQVRKLGVSGINRDNIRGFCSAILAHGHLQSLSVRLDEDSQDFFSCLDGMPEPLRGNLRRLNLYGHLDKLPAWIKHFSNLIKLDIEMTILTQEMMDFLADTRYPRILRLHVNPIQDVEHSFSLRRRDGNVNFLSLRVLEIDCSSRLRLTIGEGVMESLYLLKVHCSSGSQISGLAHLKRLKKIWVVGCCDMALKQDLERQLVDHPSQDKPVLRLEEGSSS